jgi:hypothetical protein
VNLILTGVLFYRNQLLARLPNMLAISRSRSSVGKPEAIKARLRAI